MHLTAADFICSAELRQQAQAAWLQAQGIGHGGGAQRLQHWGCAGLWCAGAPGIHACPAQP